MINSQIWSRDTNVVSNKSIGDRAKIDFDLHSLKQNSFIQMSLTGLGNQDLCLANLCCFEVPGSNSHCTFLNGFQQCLGFEQAI